MECPNCSKNLKYKGELAAPGYGRSWECDKCEEAYFQSGETLTNWKDVDPQIFEGY
jgi:hypothetical protein